LHAHRDVFDPHIGLDTEAIFAAQVEDALPGLLVFEHPEAGGLHTEENILKDGEHLNQFEMLVDHADFKVVGIIGVIDLDDLAIFPDHAAVWLVQAKQDAHQGAFAGSVFAQQGMDFAAPQLQGHPVIGQNPGELLGNVFHFNDVIAHGHLCALCEKARHLSSLFDSDAGQAGAGLSPDSLPHRC